MKNTKNNGVVNVFDRNNASKEYWEGKVVSDLVTTSLYYDFQNNHGHLNEKLEFVIDSNSSDEILRMSNSKHMLIFSILASAFSVGVSKYTLQKDISIGIPSYGAYEEEQEYDEVLPLITTIEDGMSMKEYIRKTHKTILEGYKNQFYSVRKIMNLVGVSEEIINIGIMYEQLHDNALISQIIKAAPYDIAIVFKNINNVITGEINYNGQKYKQSTISRLGNHFNVLLNNIFANMDSEINSIEMLSEEEKRLILNDFNDTKLAYPKGKLIHELFEEQAEANPDSVALIFQGESLSYEQLNQQSNQVARNLRNRGVKPDELIGIFINRSIEMIVGILGILKAGGAYLPIDPDYPEDRVKYILEDAHVQILLTESKYSESLQESYEELQVVDLEEEREREIRETTIRQPL